MTSRWTSCKTGVLKIIKMNSNYNPNSRRLRNTSVPF
jgi:hypothetical protein